MNSIILFCIALIKLLHHYLQYKVTLTFTDQASLAAGGEEECPPDGPAVVQAHGHRREDQECGTPQRRHVQRGMY